MCTGLKMALTQTLLVVEHNEVKFGVQRHYQHMYAIGMMEYLWNVFNRHTSTYCCLQAECKGP